MPVDRYRKKQSHRNCDVPSRRPYLDWTTLAINTKLAVVGVEFLPIMSLVDSGKPQLFFEWLTFELTSMLANEEAKAIGVKLGPAHLRCIVKSLIQIRRAGLLEFKDDTIADIDNSVKLTEEGKDVWSELGNIDAEGSTPRKQRGLAQTKRLRQFKASVKIGKALTNNQLDRECRDAERKLKQYLQRKRRAVDRGVGTSTLSLPLSSSKATSVSPALQTPPLDGLDSGEQETQTPPVTPIRRHFGSLTSNPLLSFYGGLASPLPEAGDSDMDVDEPSIYTSNSNCLPVTPALQRSNSLNNPLAYPSPVSAQRPAHINAEAGTSQFREEAQFSPSKGVQADDLSSSSKWSPSRIWTGIKRFFGEDGTPPNEPSNADELITTIGNRFDELTAAVSEGKIERLELQRIVDDLRQTVLNLEQDGKVKQEQVDHWRDKTGALQMLCCQLRSTLVGNVLLD